MQSCYNDAEDISKLIECGKCISIGYHVINNYKKNNEITYRFRMLKKESLKTSQN